MFIGFIPVIGKLIRACKKSVTTIDNILDNTNTKRR